MTRDISKEKVLPIIEAAFAPLECAAKFDDRDNIVHFRVFDSEGEPLLNVEDVLMQRLQNTDGMKSIIDQSRDSLIERGYKLDPWLFSDAESSYPAFERGAKCAAP